MVHGMTHDDRKTQHGCEIRIIIEVDEKNYKQNLYTLYYSRLVSAADWIESIHLLLVCEDWHGGSPAIVVAFIFIPDSLRSHRGLAIQTKRNASFSTMPFNYCFFRFVMLSLLPHKTSPSHHLEHFRYGAL